MDDISNHLSVSQEPWRSLNISRGDVKQKGRGTVFAVMSRIPTQIDCSERGQLGARRSEHSRDLGISVFDSFVHRGCFTQQGYR